MINFIAKHKTVIGVLLMIIGALWLIPTLAVRRTACRITDVTLTDDSGQKTDVYSVTYTYTRGGKEQTATYRQTCRKNVAPKIEEGVCHYWTIPPYPVFRGDAKSPVPPIVCFVLGFLLVGFRFPWFRLRKKKE